MNWSAGLKSFHFELPCLEKKKLSWCGILTLLSHKCKGHEIDSCLRYQSKMNHAFCRISTCGVVATAWTWVLIHLELRGAERGAEQPKCQTCWSRLQAAKHRAIVHWAAASHVPASKRSSLLQISAHSYTVIELTGALTGNRLLQQQQLWRLIWSTLHLKKWEGKERKV